MKTEKGNLTELGKAVKKQLIDLHMTQTKLAEQIGCSKQYLSKILTGERNGNLYLDKILDAMHLPPDEKYKNNSNTKKGEMINGVIKTSGKEILSQ